MWTGEIGRNRNFLHMENHLFECIYDMISSNIPEADKFLELQRHKAKLVPLQATRREKIMLDTSEYGRMYGEEPSLYHLLKTHRRRDTQAILQVQD